VKPYELAAVVLDADQHEIVLALDRSRDHRIELLAIDVDNGAPPWLPCPQALHGWRNVEDGVHRVRIVPDSRLGIDTRVTVSVDGGRPQAVPLFAAGATRLGFAEPSSPDDFAYGGGVGAGLGGGHLGAGPLGLDGCYLVIELASLPPGDRVVTFDAIDPAGVTVLQHADVLNVHAASSPPPAPTVWIDTDFILHWA